MKSKVLVVGGTGFVGRRMVRASLEQGHETYVLQRSDIGMDIEKIQLLLSFKREGARVVEGSFFDHQSLVEAVKKVDVVISAMSGSHVGHNLLLQLKLIEAIKEAGNIKRFLPSEFGADPDRLGHALEPGRVIFDDKVQVRRAIEAAKIPFTYISANCLAGYFAGNLSQMGTFLPPKDKIKIYGTGNVKVPYNSEDDVGTFTIKAMDDPRTLNKTLFIRTPENILTQVELLEIWEKLSGKTLERVEFDVETFLASMKDEDLLGRVGVSHYYHFFYEGCLSNFDVKEAGGVDALELYPEVKYTLMTEYLKNYL